VGRVVLVLVRTLAVGLFWLWALSGFLAVGAALVGGVVAHFIHDPAAPAAAATMPPVTHLIVAPKDDLPDRGTRPPPLPAMMFLCGVGHWATVSIVPCDIPGDLVGFAELTRPKGAAHDCVDGWDAYSRGNHYWICWTDFWPPPSVHPWARAPNPWSIPVGEGGASHEHR
jgi:hypothetical protein